ncbi:MAG TPA: DNA repair protein RecN [Hyphomonadaceae bacterium]|nr:DNA repair protein RecN [Hyphomonadaceae bacterium]
MLTGLSIRDFVLVRALDLDLGSGFSALTGETGAGKSILMSALGFALGARATQGLIRPGADAASVAASFEIGPRHPVRALLAARGVEEAPDEPLVFRRVIKRGGAARAFLNDRPVSAALVEEAGAVLADVHGQHEGLGLLNASRHRALLDAYAGAEKLLAETARTWTALRCAEEARAALEARLSRASAERSWLTHSLEELDLLDPQEGETHKLAIDRAMMQAGERVADAIASAAQTLSKANVEHAIASASRTVSRSLGAPGLAGEGAASELAVRMRAACESLERALIEAGEARSALDAAHAACEFSPAALEASETRLFALRAAARKHDLDPDQLPNLHKRLRMQLDEIEHSDGALAATMEAEARARSEYSAAADKLTAAREGAARKLAKAVGHELPPLKLDKARFRVAVSRREAGPAGQDDVVFEIETNAGAGFGPLNRIASGGEMARFALAVSVVLAATSPCGTLVFDEADVGVGGAVAAAVGERLARLGQERQVVAITHSPQVAAAAERQMRVSKAEAGGEVVTSVDTLSAKARKEEIARMLAGANVTREARAAAGRLLAGA